MSHRLTIQNYVNTENSKAGMDWNDADGTERVISWTVCSRFPSYDRYESKRHAMHLFNAVVYLWAGEKGNAQPVITFDQPLYWKNRRTSQ